MVFAGLAPILDLLFGGILTAGMAFGMYKFGMKKTTRSAAEMDAGRLDARMALTRRASEMEMAGLSQPDAPCRQLARSLRQTMDQASAAGSSGGNNTVGATASDFCTCSSSAASVSMAASGDSSNLDPSVAARTREEDTRNLASDRKLSDMGRPSTSRSSYASIATQTGPIGASTSAAHQDAYSDDLPTEVPPVLDDSIPLPPELRRKTEIIRERIRKRVNVLLAAMEANYQSLTTELREQREALDVARRERAEAEQSGQRTEAYMQEAKEKLERKKQQVEAKIHEGKKLMNLLRQVKKMEDELDFVYRHVETPCSVTQDQAQEQEWVREQLQQQKIKISHHQELLRDMCIEIDDLNEKISNLRGGMTTLCQENLELQRYRHSACPCSRVMTRNALQMMPQTEGRQLGVLNVPYVALPITLALEVTITRFQLH